MRETLSRVGSDGCAARVPAQADTLTPSGVPISKADALLTLQRTRGNHFVRRLLSLGLLQTELRISEPDDKYQREAERLSERVISNDVSDHAHIPRGSAQRKEGIQDQTQDEEELKLQRQAEKHRELRRQMVEGEEVERLQLQVEPEREGVVQHKRESEGDLEVGRDWETRIEMLRGGGYPLPDTVQAFFEPRFGYDFSGVRIHTDSQSEESAKDLNALAYTVGNNIVFGAGQYQPQTAAGRHLLAHELTHVIQQRGAIGGDYSLNSRVQRAVTFDECTLAEETIVLDSHTRALQMVDTAITKLGGYNGTTPADVQAALTRRFHSNGTGLAAWIAFNLTWLKGQVDSPQYECEKPQVGSRLGWSMWCIPWTDIELYPLWFAESDIDIRARTIIHEWVHRYGCNFDLGYEWEAGYSGHGTLRSLLNADPWAHFVYDVR